MSSTLETVEKAILEGLRSWLTRLDLNYDPDEPSDDESELSAIRKALEAAEAEDARLRAQRLKAYDLVEQGVYTPDVFAARMATLARDLEAVAKQTEQLTKEQEHIIAAAAARSNLIPNVQHVLEAYEAAETPQEKNDLLRTVLSKVVYHKTRRERWAGGSDLTLTLYPVVK